MDIHKAKLEAARAVVDTSAPEHMHHLDHNAKKAEMERQKQLELAAVCVRGGRVVVRAMEAHVRHATAGGGGWAPPSPLGEVQRHAAVHPSVPTRPNVGAHAGELASVRPPRRDRGL